jgi:hypothetical protein
MTIKKFQCPFCCESFNSRMFLNGVHMPKCSKREAYFNKLLEPVEMEQIKVRIDGGIYHTEKIKNSKFEGKALKEDY